MSAQVRMREIFEAARLLPGMAGRYRTRLTRSPEEVRRAQALRFEVFNLELHEGLESSFGSGLDADPYDAVCDHLIVEHEASGAVVGTYRLQTGVGAAAGLGYYSGQEFDLAPYEPRRAELIELGRACVHKNHRNLVVLGLLWKGIADYARGHGGRYLFGCSSLTSQDPAEGARAFQELSPHYLAEPEWRTVPLAGFECPLQPVAKTRFKTPKLLGAYLAIGGRIAGPPAIDREFKTIDFLTVVDLARIPEAVRKRFLQ